MYWLVRVDMTRYAARISLFSLLQVPMFWVGGSAFVWLLVLVDCRSFFGRIRRSGVLGAATRFVLEYLYIVLVLYSINFQHFILLSIVFLQLRIVHNYRTWCIGGVSIRCVGIMYLVSGNAIRVFRLVVSLSCFRGSFEPGTLQHVLLRRAAFWWWQRRKYINILLLGVFFFFRYCYEWPPFKLMLHIVGWMAITITI